MEESYNIFQGHQKSSFGSISPFFATTHTLLNKFEWLDIDFDTDIHSLMLSLKSTTKNLNNYVDTNSVVMNGLDYFKNGCVYPMVMIQFLYDNKFKFVFVISPHVPAFSPVTINSSLRSVE